MSRQSLIGLVIVSLLAAGIVWWQRSAKTSGHTVDVKIPELDRTATAGRALFTQNCASCHGAAAGGAEQGPPLVHITYEPNHHPDQAFYIAAKIGVRQHHWRFGDMPPVEAVNEQQLAKIIAYVRALQRANGIN